MLFINKFITCYLLKYSLNTLIHAHTGSQHRVVKAHHDKFSTVHLSLFSSLHQRVTVTVQHVMKSPSGSAPPLLARHWMCPARVDSSVFKVSPCEKRIARPGIPTLTWRLQLPKGFACLLSIHPSIHAILHANFFFQPLVRCPAKLFSLPEVQLPPVHPTQDAVFPLALSLLHLKRLLVILTVTTRTTWFL